MFPLPISTYLYSGLVLISIVCFGYGRYQHNALVEYKIEVKAIAIAQEAKIESIKKQQTLVNQGIEKEYNAKLTLLRQYYANGVRDTSSGKLPSISNASDFFNAIPSNSLLACAETTQQLVSLQDWLNQQMGVK